jgi:hypothetical protein
MPYRVKTVDYANKKGTVTAITEDELMVIDGETILIDTPNSQRIVDISRVDLGDSVEYNTRSTTGELIYLRVTERAPKKSTPMSAKDACCKRVEENRVAGYYVGGGEMANMALASRDPYDEWVDGDTM